MQRNPKPGACSGQLVGQPGDIFGQRTEQQRQDQLLTHHHLLEVEDLRPGGGYRVHQLNRHARGIGAGDGRSQRLPLVHDRPGPLRPTG